ncbi:nucleotidyltransferase family protein [Streptomyces malaysiensis]|uniref:nucleotidyltransferase family protein n=1 Tax=Streptomyces malaysiensis TaxID=92644 RepID=UPI000852A5BD|nr:nucleotidyltransferase family protein [Streptomyces sp. SPMA113]
MSVTKAESPEHTDPLSDDDTAWAVLELVAEHQGLDAEPDARASYLNRPGFEHGELVQQAMRHNLLPALADFLNRHGLRKALPHRLRTPVLNYLRLSEHRARLLTREAVRVSDGLARAGVRAAWTKGVTLQSTLFDNTAVRPFNDIDLMIAPDDREPTKAVLIDLGYTPDAAFDPETGKLKEISRLDQRMYRMSRDHLPHLRMLTDDICVPHISVDVANSLTWHGSRWQVPMRQVIERIETVPVLNGSTLPALSAPHAFLFLCLHVFREGWLQRTIVTKDLALSQFADILRQWRRSSPDLRRDIQAAIEEFGLAEPMAWVCGHTDALFRTRLLEELGLTEQADPLWSASAQGAGGQPLTWHGDMRRRLRESTPPALSPLR